MYHNDVFRARPGWWWNVGLRFFQKKVKNNFAPKFIFSDVDYISTVLKFLSILGGGRGWGELRLSHLSKIFDFLIS